MTRVLLFALSWWLCAAPHPAVAQSSDPSPPLDFRNYARRVAETNLAALAARAGVDQAQARIDVARIFPSPRLSGGLAAVDISGNRLEDRSRAGNPVVNNNAATMTSAQLDVPIELGGRLDRRVDVARAEHAQAGAEFDALLQRLRADAAIAWIDALHASMILARRRGSLEELERLVQFNEMRLASGAIGEIAVVQSRVEARRYQGQVLRAEGEADAARDALLAFLGDGGADRPHAPFSPRGTLSIPAREFDERAVIQAALANRADVAASEHAISAANHRRSLAHAMRWPDFSLGVNWSHSFQNLGSPSYTQPEYDTLGATASIELPLRLFFDGDLREAEGRILETEFQARALRLAIAVQARGALRRYDAARRQLALYEGSILSDADRVLEAARYSYARGGGSLLEVLIAQRTADEVYLDYYDALAEHARLRVEIERIAGIPSLEF